MTLEIRVDVSGFAKHERELGRKLERALAGVAEGIATDIKTGMGTSPGGRVYKRGRGRHHTASSAGHPPNVDSGTLRASIRQARTGKLERTVFTGVEYARYLEEGTSRMAARPFMKPVFDKAARSFGRDLKRAGRF